jgi:hypothetical protein
MEAAGNKQAMSGVTSSMSETNETPTLKANLIRLLESINTPIP